MYLALGARRGTSGSNSTGKPKKPLNLSKVTWATWRTLVGQLISMAQRSLVSLLQATKDFLKMAMSRVNKDNWSPSASLSRENATELLLEPPSASSSSSTGSPLGRRMELGAQDKQEGGAQDKEEGEEEVDGEGEGEGEGVVVVVGEEGKWRTSVMALKADDEWMAKWERQRERERESFSWKYYFNNWEKEGCCVVKDL